MAAVNRALGEDLEIQYQFSIGINGVATTVRYGQIPAIEALRNVKAVYIENQYAPDQRSPTPLPPAPWWAPTAPGPTATPAQAPGLPLLTQAWIWIIPALMRNAISMVWICPPPASARTWRITTSSPPGEVAGVLPKLHAAELYGGLTAEELYRSAKVPFAFNYIDEDLDVTHDNDTQGDHGTHVSGIATANTYVWSKDADGDMVAARQENGVVGVAPDAQILAMKVFGKNGGAYDSDYMAAIEDAILLGCDTVNLSLGSSMPGHTYGDYDALFERLVDSDTVVTISAGNKYSYAEFNNTGVGLQLTDDTVINTVGSPAPSAAPSPLPLWTMQDSPA